MKLFFTSPLLARDFWNENKSLFGSLFLGVSLANFFSALNACDCLCARRSVAVIVLGFSVPLQICFGPLRGWGSRGEREQAKLHLLSLCSIKLHDNRESGAFGCSWASIDMQPHQIELLYFFFPCRLEMTIETPLVDAFLQLQLKWKFLCFFFVSFASSLTLTMFLACAQAVLCGA